MTDPTIESLQAELTAAKEKATAREVELQKELSDAIKRRKTSLVDNSTEERKELLELRAAVSASEEQVLKDKGNVEALTAVHQKKIDAEQTKTSAALKDLENARIDAFFGTCGELFGPGGVSTVSPARVRDTFGQYVRYVPGENGEPGGVTVHDLKGVPITTTDDGKPATNAAALERLIRILPDKDQLLRGGGRTGSGSIGAGDTIDLSVVTHAEVVRRAAAGDQAAIAELRNLPASSQVSGPIHEKRARAARQPT